MSDTLTENDATYRMTQHKMATQFWLNAASISPIALYRVTGSLRHFLLKILFRQLFNLRHYLLKYLMLRLCGPDTPSLGPQVRLPETLCTENQFCEYPLKGLIEKKYAGYSGHLTANMHQTFASSQTMNISHI